MKKLILFIGFIIAVSVLHVTTVNAFPTSTVTQNLFITDLRNNGVKCLQITNTGLVVTSTSACFSGGGGLASSSPFTANLIPFIIDANTLQGDVDLRFETSTNTFQVFGTASSTNLRSLNNSTTRLTVLGVTDFTTSTLNNGNLSIGSTTNSVVPITPAQNQLLTVARTFTPDEAVYGIKLALDASSTGARTQETVGVDVLLSTGIENEQNITGDLIAYRADLQDWAVVGTLSNYYAFQQKAPLLLRTVTNGYGFYYSGSGGAVNPWAFYNVSTDPSHLGGGLNIVGHTTSTNVSSTGITASTFLQGSNLNITGAGTAAIVQSNAQVKGRLGVGALGTPQTNSFIIVNEQLAPHGTTEIVALDLGFGVSMTSTRSVATIGVRGRVNILGSGANTASYSGNVIGVTGEVRNNSAQSMSLKNMIGFWASPQSTSATNASSVTNFYSDSGIFAGTYGVKYGFYHAGFGSVPSSSWAVYALVDPSYFTGLINAGNATTTTMHVSSTLNVVGAATLNASTTLPTASSTLKISDGDLFLGTSTRGVIYISPSGVCVRQTMNASLSFVTSTITCP